MCIETIRFGNITVLESAFLIAKPCIQNGLEYWNGIPGKKENEDSEQRNWIENVTGNLGNGKAMVRIALLVKLFLCLLWRNIYLWRSVSAWALYVKCVRWTGFASVATLNGMGRLWASSVAIIHLDLLLPSPISKCCLFLHVTGTYFCVFDLQVKNFVLTQC